MCAAYVGAYEDVVLGAHLVRVRGKVAVLRALRGAAARAMTMLQAEQLLRAAELAVPEHFVRDFGGGSGARSVRVAQCERERTDLDELDPEPEEPCSRGVADANREVSRARGDCMRIRRG